MFADSEAAGPHGNRDNDNVPTDPSHPQPGRQQSVNPFDESDVPDHLLNREDENAEAGPSRRPVLSHQSPDPLHVPSDPEHTDDEDDEVHSQFKAYNGTDKTHDDDLPPSSPFRPTSPPLSEHEAGQGKENAAPHHQNFTDPPSSAFGHPSPHPSKRDQGKGETQGLSVPPPLVAVNAAFQAPPPSLKRCRDEYEDKQATNCDDIAGRDDEADSNYDPNPDEEEPLLPPPKKARLPAPKFTVDMGPRRASAPQANGRTGLGPQPGPSRQTALPAGNFQALSLGGAISAQHHYPHRTSLATTEGPSPPGSHFPERLLSMYVDAAESRRVDGGNYSASHEQSAEERAIEEEVKTQEHEEWRRERRAYEFRARQSPHMSASRGGIVLHERPKSQKQDWEWDTEMRKGPNVWMPRFQESYWSMK